MKDIITLYLTGKEGISWVKIKVHDGDRLLDYYIPAFTNPPIVYDEERSKYVRERDYTNDPTVPILPRRAIQGLHFFSEHPKFHRNVSKFASGFVVSDTLRKALKKARLTNLLFEKLPPGKFVD